MRHLALCLVMWAVGAGALAQNYNLNAAPDIVSIDRERVFNESQTGQIILQEIENRTQNLQAENQRIDRELTAEEQSLAEQRKTDSPEVFAVKAEDFDEKVQRIRQEQESKGQAIVEYAQSARDAFFDSVADVLRNYMIQHGVIFVLEANTVLMSARQADITDEVIERLDQR